MAIDWNPSNINEPPLAFQSFELNHKPKNPMRFYSKKLDRLRMQLKQLIKSARIDCFTPFVLLFVMNLIAFLNMECCIMVFLVLPVMLSCFYIYSAKKCAR